MNPNVKMICQLIISITVILPFWGLVYLMFFKGAAIDPSVKEPLNTIIANVVPIFAGVFGFWLGTSLSSAAKDSLLANKGTANAP